MTKEQLIYINKFFYSSNVQELLKNKEQLSLDDFKKIGFELAINVKNRSPFLFSQPYIKYFKDYEQALKIINEFKSLNMEGMNSTQITDVFTHIYQLCEYKASFDKLVEEYTKYTSTLYSAKDILKCIDFANDNSNLFDSKTIDQLNEIKTNINDFFSNIKYFGDSFEYENFELLHGLVDKYNGIASSIWKSYVKDSISKEDTFRYLVHDGIIKGKKYYDGTISTSLITNDHLTTFGEGYGIIVKPISIESAVPRDNGTDNSATIKNTNTKNGTRVIYLPQQVEQESREKQCYSEIALTEHEIIGVFAINNQYNSIIKEIQARLLARRLQVPFVKIDSKTKTQKISNVNETKKDLGKDNKDMNMGDKEMKEKASAKAQEIANKNRQLQAERQRQIQHNMIISQVEKMLSMRITDTSGYIYDSETKTTKAVKKDTNQLSQELGQVHSKIDKLFYEGEIDSKLRSKMHLEVINQYNSMIANAPKPTIPTSKVNVQAPTSSVDDYTETELFEEDLPYGAKKEEQKASSFPKFKPLEQAKHHDFVQQSPKHQESKSKFQNMDDKKKEQESQKRKENIEDLKRMQEMVEIARQQKMQQDFMNNQEEMEEDQGMSL